MDIAEILPTDYEMERKDKQGRRKKKQGYLKNKRLKPDAVPSVWPGCPPHLTKPAQPP